ncbi:MAG: DUF3999 domain-containing protein [Desulfamplus sp.]|nr:DUF3999 domain-containing protein [Desulfamplus sp.]
MKKYIFLILLFATASDSVYCESLSTKDFAYGFTLNVNGDSPIYKMELPEAVYQGVLRQDLGDIRIFNSSGEIVPHLLRSTDILDSSDMLRNDEALSVVLKEGEPISEKQIKNNKEENNKEENNKEENNKEENNKEENNKYQIDIPFFPLYNENRSEKVGDLSMSITQNKDGTIIRVDSSKQQEIISKNDKITGYLFDMSNFEPYPLSVELEWSGGGDNFVLNVELKGSNDLTQWYFLKNKTLAKLKFGGNAIYQNQISFDENNLYRYLRLSWLSGDLISGEQNSKSDAQLLSVKAIFPKAELKIKREWREITGNFSKTNNMIVDFDSGGYFPVDAVQIKFHQNNSIIRAEIQSAKIKENLWQYRCEGIFYSLKVGGVISNQISNEIFTFPITSDRFWRIKIGEDGAGVAGAVYPPILKIGWRPHEILFVARGNPPYTLAYGSAKLLNKNIDSQTIPEMILNSANIEEQRLDTYNNISNSKTNTNKPHILNATYTKPIILGGDEALKLPPPPLPWKKWLLWAVLIFGLCLLSFMTWRLATQMRDK